MSRNIKILMNYLLYFATFIIVCIIGITGVFADTYEDIGYLSDYSDVIVEVNYTSSPLPLYKDNTYQLTEVIAMNINVSNFTFLGGTTYSLEFWTPDTKLTYANAFTIVGNDINNNPVKCTTIGINGPEEFLNFKFNCSSNVNYINLRIYNSSNNYIMDTGIFSWKYVYLRKITSSTDTSILEGQASQIIQGQQDIIKNNNQNTQELIDSNKVCNTRDINYNNGISNGYLNNQGTLNNDNNYTTTDYIEGISKITLTNTNDSDLRRLCFYTKDKTFISCLLSEDYSNNDTISIPSNTFYTRFSFRKSSLSPTYRVELCLNGNQANNDAINNLDNTLKDDNVDDNGVADAFESFNDYLDDNSTITQLITLPITLYTAILNNLNGTCSPFNLGELYGESLILPCINISQYLGNSLWTMIDIIISGFAVYAISKKMIKVFNNFSSLREGDVIDD